MTEAHPITQPYPAPPMVLKLLDKLAVPYRTCFGHEALPARQCLQAVLVEDGVGAMMVIFSQDQLLDLSRLTELTGRKLQAIKTERMQRMLDKHALQQLPALPALTSSPCLYEQSLLEQELLYVQSGYSGVWLAIAQEDMRRLLEKCTSARFGQPLQVITPNLDRPGDDKAEITQAVQAFTSRRIQQRLEEVTEIPPLPETAQKIIKLRVNSEVSTDDVTGLVETDPALAAQVVSWAASPYYAAPGKIRSVEDAIVRVLGFDLVINLALGLALGKSLSLPNDRPQQAPPYWQQAIYSAALIEGLTRAMPREKRPEAGLSYLSGLLHNFGYLVLAHVFPPHFSLICRHLEVNPHLRHSVVEQYLLGITREQVGAWLMSYWDMPEEIYCALRFQNDPSYSGPYSAYPNLLSLTNSLLCRQGIISGAELEIPNELYQRLGLTPEKAELALKKIIDAESALRELATLQR